MTPVQHWSQRMSSEDLESQPKVACRQRGGPLIPQSLASSTKECLPIVNGPHATASFGFGSLRQRVRS